MQEKDNHKIEQLLKQIGTRREKKQMDQLMELLQESYWYIPAKLPPNVSREVMEKIRQAGDDLQDMSSYFSDNMPQPLLIQDNGANKYLPLFSSKLQVPEENSYPLLLYFPFSSCINLTHRLKDVKAIALNPFTDNLILQPGNVKNKTKQNDKEQNKANVMQLLRIQTESNDIPFAFHHQGDTFMEQLDEKREDYILEFYQDRYKKNKIPCPFTAGNFEVMYLAVTKDMEIARVTLPATGGVPGMPSIFFLTKKLSTNEKHFYALVKGRADEKDFIGEILPNGSKAKAFDAPPEGSEMNAILEKLGESV